MTAEERNGLQAGWKEVEEVNEVKEARERRAVTTPSIFASVASKGVAGYFLVSVAAKRLKVAGFSVSCAAAVSVASTGVTGGVLVNVADKGVTGDVESDS